RPSGLNTFPADLCDLYYRVRFGDMPLSTAEIGTLHTKLSQLEQSLRDG
ncbi:MAG: hypothetical protein HZA46_06940, partial [Planctomycetales bacterium]|nr:hypothetical protein [Planctomycetales bacterium]